MVLERRRERERVAMRQGIIDAAQDIAAEEGWQAVTIRRVAERIEYSPPLIYKYFESKEAILNELRREGYRKLEAEMANGIASTPNPKQQFLMIGRAYSRFAQLYPELYQVMHGLSGIPCEPFGDGSDWIGFNRLIEFLKGFVQATGANIPDFVVAFHQLRGMAHGLVSLQLLGEMPGGWSQVEQLLDQYGQQMLTIWGVA